MKELREFQEITRVTNQVMIGWEVLALCIRFVLTQVSIERGEACVQRMMTFMDTIHLKCLDDLMVVEQLDQ